jgi:alpha-beta hydrolase superfamily lysophospholipase
MIRFVQRRWKTIFRLLLILIAVGLAGSWIFGSVFSAPCNHAVALPKDLPVETVTFPSASGATIHGWLVQPATNRGVVILQHGVHADKATLVGRAKFLSRAGYAVLLFDFQAHGESIGKQITFGHLESRDSQAAVAFVKKRFPNQPVGVIGVSLGGAAALLAQPPLAVQALVLESVFPDIVNATKDRMEFVLGRPARLLSPLLTAQLKWRIGVGPEVLRPIDGAAKSKVPKLFLAGTKDQRTKFSESQAMFANAAEPKSFFPVEGADHEDLHHFLGLRYEQLILEFLENNLK